MRKLFLLIVLPLLLSAQQTRREEVRRSPNPADDTRPNSAKVPDVYAMNTQFRRVVVLRFKYETDLLAGLEKMVAREKIHNAIILSAFGSVRGYQVHQVSNRTFPSKDMYTKDPTAPADIIGMNGAILGGRVHAHITLANPQGAFGGHLEPGTTVFTFASVTLGVLGDDIDLTRVDDKAYR